jgi:hypothetical protein
LAPLPGEVLGASVSLPDTVTHAELTAALDELSNSLKQIVYANLSAPNSLPATGGYTNSIALTQSIDQLSNVTISNATVHGVSGLTAADIPTNIVAGNYLPLAGGALTGDLTGTDLTLTGNLTVAGAQTLSGAITVPYVVATSTTAVSSLQQLLANGSTTLQNFTFVNATGMAATTTALFATLGHFTTGIIDTLTSTLANFGIITATNATITNSTTTNEYSSNLAAAAARFGATATSSFSSAGALTLASPLAVSSGGTGWAAVQSGAIPYGNGSSALSTTTAGTGGQVLALLNGVPTWTATTSLSTISGTLGVANGGTATTTFYNCGIVFSEGDVRDQLRMEEFIADPSSRAADPCRRDHFERERAPRARKSSP